MKHTFAGAALALLLLSSTVFALPVSAAAPIFKADPEETPDLSSRPTLTVAYNGGTQAALPGGFSWNRMIADAAGTLQVIELPFFTHESGVNTVGLSFSLKPDSVTVRHWESAARGNIVDGSLNEVVSGGSFSLPADGGSYICEVTGHWNRSGYNEYVSYAFEIGARSGALTMPEKLPREYTPETAAQNGDVVTTAAESRNTHKIPAFIAKVNAGIVASLRVTSFGRDGGPHIYDLFYDGAKIRCVHDSTRDDMSSAEDRRIVSSIHDTADTKSEYSDAYGHTRTTFFLGSRANPNRIQVVGGGFQLPDAVMATQRPAYDAYIKTIKVDITNNTKGELTYEEKFELELQSEGVWTRIGFDGEFEEWVGIVKPGETVACSVPMRFVEKPLADGVYRIVKRLRYNGRGNDAFAEFTVGNPPKEPVQPPLALEQPVTIMAVYGAKNAVELTRKGKYEGSSPLVYATKELEKCNGSPPVAEEGTYKDSLVLSVGYASGSAVLTIFDNGRIRVGNSVYDGGDAGLYGRIKACAAAAAASTGGL